MAAQGHRNVSQRSWNLLGWVKASCTSNTCPDSAHRAADGYLGWMKLSQAFPSASQCSPLPEDVWDVLVTGWGLRMELEEGGE